MVVASKSTFKGSSDAQRIGRWKKHPEIFLREILGTDPWEKQEEILHSVKNYKETFVQSANAVGKTHIAAAIVLWWLFTRKGVIVTTAPTWRQVQDVLWQNVRSYVEGMKDVFGVQAHLTRIEVGPRHYATGLSTTEPSKFQGYHNPDGVLIVVDEACGVENEEIWGAIDGNLTSNRDRLLAIGNPTDPSGVFAKRCRSPVKGLRKVIKISAFDTPNLKAGKEVINGLVTKEWVDLRTAEWGVGSPLYQARIMGEFPKTGGDSLFPLAWLERAFNYDPTPPPLGLGPLDGGFKAIGVDVAGSGNDNNALALRDGGKLLSLKGYPTIEPDDLVDDVFGIIEQRGVDVDKIVIDAVGIGWPIYRAMARKRNKMPLRYHDLSVTSFVAQAKPLNDRRFSNRKAEAYWNLRELLRTNKIDLFDIPQDAKNIIEKQASEIRYWPNGKGQIVIEEKKSLRARTGWSPDELEALIMAFLGASKVRREAASDIDYTQGGGLRHENALDVYGVAEIEHDWDRYDREWRGLDV